MLKTGELVKFDGAKHFIHVNPLGAGGTGDAHLFKDETTDMLFAIKKYSPKGSNDTDETFKRFVDEIKILFKISHLNIVRIYNYYLYPEAKSGYLQMEYIDGMPIDKFEPEFFGKNWEDIFKEVIYAFEYLESNRILHRDIRPSNILIDRDENVKIIDFGFGKKLETTENEGKSVYLNWPVTQLPNETELDGIYNHQTEVYFTGKLFQSVLGAGITEFKFNYIIDKMIRLDPSSRYSSFSEISRVISNGVIGEIDFTQKEKDVYVNFADALIGCIACYNGKYVPIQDTGTTITRLVTLIRNSSLENFIQDKSQLVRCFINGSYVERYRYEGIPVSHVKDFYLFLVQLPSYKQKIVLDNIYTRLSKIDVRFDDDEELPF